MNGHEPVKDPQGPFIWTLLPTVSQPRNDSGGQLVTQKQARWVREREPQKELKRQAGLFVCAATGQQKLKTESCKLVTETQFRRRKRVRMIKSRRT